MGGSCSTGSESVVIPMSVPFNPISLSTPISTVSPPTRYIENCVIIWLLDEFSPTLEDEIYQLHRSMYGLKIFTDSETCLDYIKDVQDERIFLILSTTDHFATDRFSSFTQIERIYLYNSRRNHQIEQANVFREIDHLRRQLQEDMDLCEYDLIYLSVVSTSSKDLHSSMTGTRALVSFAFTQIINEIMIRFKFESRAKDVLVDFCRQHYANNHEQLSLIDQFAKHYRPNTALDWLTKPCFISKMIHHAERTREIDILYKLGFFFRHLSNQLFHLHEQNLLSLKTISVVYRGKTLSNEEFHRLLVNKHGELLTISNPLITTVNKDQTLDFVRRRMAMHPDRVAIVFEISIDHMIFNPERPFALLKSNDTKNGQVCFSPGSIFRIDSIVEVIDHLLPIQFVRLKMVEDDDDYLLSLLTPFRTKEASENPLACLGKLLMEMGEYKRVEQFFLEMLNDTSIQSEPRRLARLQNGLAANYAHKGDYSTALHYFKQALKVCLTYLPAEHPDLVPFYKNIGDCYLKEKYYTSALQSYQQAIYALESSAPSFTSQLTIDLQTLVDKTKQLIANDT